VKKSRVRGNGEIPASVLNILAMRRDFHWRSGRQKGCQEGDRFQSLNKKSPQVLIFYVFIIPWRLSKVFEIPVRR
jgi:hypothetical protein